MFLNLKGTSKLGFWCNFVIVGDRMTQAHQCRQPVWADHTDEPPALLSLVSSIGCAALIGQ